MGTVIHLVLLIAGMAILSPGVAAGPTALPTSQAEEHTEALVFLTWADYIDPAVVSEFEKERGIKVRFAYYESDDARDEMLASSDGRGYDIAIVNGLLLQAYASRNWLASIPKRDIPNLKHIDPRWHSAHSNSERYGVPYFWGTLGIAFRRDLVPEGFSSWSDFFTPAESLRGRITMLKTSRDVLGMALKSLGHSANIDDRNAIREAGKLLEAQKPFVRSYQYLSLSEKSALVTGEVWAGLMYSGDALMLQEHHDQIDYVVPSEGGNLWTDYITVFQSSPRKDLAAKFIDFLNRPEIAARNAERVYYATPNLAARAHLSKAYLDNTTIYPSETSLARSEVYRPLSPRTQKTINSVFAQLVN